MCAGLPTEDLRNGRIIARLLYSNSNESVPKTQAHGIAVTVESRFTSSYKNVCPS
jgi:hypothetical protein